MGYYQTEHTVQSNTDLCRAMQKQCELFKASDTARQLALCDSWQAPNVSTKMYEIITS